MIYDKQMVEKFREFAITNKDQLIPGNTYWMNSPARSFVFVRLLTNVEHYASLGLVWNYGDENEYSWFEAQQSGTRPNIWSLSDNNVSDRSYNPWLIFDDENLALAASKKIIIEFEENTDYEYEYD